MRSLFRAVGQAFSGLRLRLFLMMLLVCAPLVGVLFHGASEERRRARASFQVELTNVTHFTRREEKEISDATKQLLVSLSVHGHVQALDPAGARHVLEDVHESSPRQGTLPRYANLGLLSTNGQVLARAFPTPGANFGGKPLVNRVLRSRNLASSGIVFDRGEGSPSVYFGHPVFGPSNQVIGVVCADLDLNAFYSSTETHARLWKQERAWMDVDSSGKLISRYGKNPQRGLGRKFSDEWLLKAVAGQTNGVIEGVDHRGIPVVVAFSKLRSRFATPPDVVGLLAVPRAMLYAEADRTLARGLSALGTAVALALLLGWIGGKLLILRPVRALVRSSVQLASGDLSVRTGLRPSRDELGQLTAAFDQMAQALETREVEHQRASHKLQVLSHRLVEVQEAERRHIARELHDEIGQSLTAAEMNLQAALQAPRAASLQKRLEDSIEAVERVLEQVHDLSLNLRPSMLDDLGLEPALRWYTHRQASLTGMRAEFKCEPLEERLDPMIETECFRVAQEALTNVVRHAKAKAVKVELSHGDGRLHLCVSDDGVGFDVGALRDRAVRGASLGLLSMEERTSLAGGGLEFNSAPGGGTEVRAWFPLILKNGNERSE